MKITAALFIFSIFLSCSNKQANGNTISETEEINAASTIDFPRNMFAAAEYGLNRRSEPTTNSTIVGVYVHGDSVRVFGRSNTAETIDGITDYWYQTLSGFWLDGEWRQSWVFGGFLSDELPSGVPIVLGQWGVRDNMNFRYFFWPDNRWYERYFAGEAAHGGTWELDGNILTLRRAAIWLRQPDEGEGEVLTIELSIIDQSNIDLRFDENRIVGLTRIER